MNPTALTHWHRLVSERDAAGLDDGAPRRHVAREVAHRRRRVALRKEQVGLGLGVTLVPDATQQLPDFVRQVFATPITLSGLTAIILSLALPEEAGETAAVDLSEERAEAAE